MNLILEGEKVEQGERGLTFTLFHPYQLTFRAFY